MHVCARVFARKITMQLEIAISFISVHCPLYSEQFDTSFSYSWILIKECASIKVCSTRACELLHLVKYGQKYACIKFIIAHQKERGPPIFFTWLDNLWTIDMISCRIWPSITSWRHQNGAGTQKYRFAFYDVITFM